VPFFEDPPDHADVGAWDDEEAGQPPGSGQELSDDGRRLLELYRLMLADSDVGDGGRLVCRASEERLAAKLGVSIPHDQAADP
jgi:hypothetical protein